MENDSPEALEDIHRLIEDIEGQLAHLKQKVSELGPVEHNRFAREKAEDFGSNDGNVTEGVFDGQNMVGPDGKIYTIPANYASKSKLVEGDIMKLTIRDDGTFIYKQIGPVERKRMTGTLVRTENGSYKAVSKAGRSYKLLTASVTYYRGDPSDVVVMLVPQDGQSNWAAVENIVPELEATDDLLDVEEHLLADGNDMLLDDGDDGQLPPPHGELALGEEIVTGDETGEEEDNR